MALPSNNARDCARFLAFCGYPFAQIRDCLTKRFGLSAEDAGDTAQHELERQARRRAEDGAKLGKYEAAVAAEHSLDRTTWR